jgi:hypothetical protein
VGGYEVSRIDLALVEWPDCPDAGGPRVLGRISDADLIEAARERIAAARRRELARIERPLRALPPVSDPDAA